MAKVYNPVVKLKRRVSDYPYLQFSGREISNCIVRNLDQEGDVLLV